MGGKLHEVKINIFYNDLVNVYLRPRFQTTLRGTLGQRTARTQGWGSAV